MKEQEEVVNVEAQEESPIKVTPAVHFLEFHQKFEDGTVKIHKVPKCFIMQEPSKQAEGEEPVYTLFSENGAHFSLPASWLNVFSQFLVFYAQQYE